MPDVAVVVHPLTSDELRVLGVPVQVEVCPEGQVTGNGPQPPRTRPSVRGSPLIVGDPGQLVVPVKLEIKTVVVPGSGRGRCTAPGAGSGILRS